MYKARFFALVIGALFAIGCGGRPALQVTITADQVFSPLAQIWAFTNAYGDTTVIDVQPQPDGTVAWHYTKDNARAYWTTGAANAELFFFLAKDPDGGWYSTGSHVIFPDGCSFCAGPEEFTFSVDTTPGMPRPYLIIPASGNDQAKASLNTTFAEFGNPAMTWRTDSYVENVTTSMYSGPALVSEQWEGPCTHEKWYFAPSLGLVKVEPLDAGDCKGLDPNLTMERQPLCSSRDVCGAPPAPSNF